MSLLESHSPPSSSLHSPLKLTRSSSSSHLQPSSLDHPNHFDPSPTYIHPNPSLNLPPRSSPSAHPPRTTSRDFPNAHPSNHPSPSPSNPSSPSSSSSDLPSSTRPSQLTPLDQAQISRWATKDRIHQHVSLQSQSQKAINVFSDIYAEALDDSQIDWLGDANSNRPPSRFRLQMPIELERTLASGKRKNRPRLKLTKQDLKIIANTEEVLVPIRLEIEIDHWKLRDTFTWNLKEPVVTPEQFAVHLCQDLILPIQHFSAPIANSIKEQLEEYKLHQNFQNHLINPLSAQQQEANPSQDVELDLSHTPNFAETSSRTDLQSHKLDPWWNGWKQRVLCIDDDTFDLEPKESKPDSKRIKLEEPTLPQLTQSSIKSRLIDHVDQNFKPILLDSVSTSSLAMADEELRIPIILDIIYGNIHLTDRFEWEISQIENCPEQFAQVYANDLGLSGEFKTAIAHSIREQIEIYVKSLALVEHISGYPVPNDELRYAFLQRVTDPIRTGQVSEFTPFLNLLNAEELDRQEKEHDREARRKRRQTRGRRGITLPDRESQRTVRNIVPLQGLDMVAPYQNDNEDLIVPVQPFAQPFAIKESVVELADSSEYQPKRHLQANKETLVPESQLGTPSKATASRASRRLRGATADVIGGTPPKTSEPNGADNSKEDAPTPSNAGTPAATHHTNSKKAIKPDSSTNANNTTSSKKPTPAPQNRGRINWEALGLHDPMIDGVWHCSNCGCPEQVAVGRRKGLGGKDTLCGDCGRYIHRYKKNRPIMYNTSAEYHTSLKLEADKAKQAIADQEMIRKEKNKPGNQNLPTSLNNKKRKKDPRNSLLPKSDKSRRTEDRSASVASSTKSGESRDSSPVVSIRSTNNGGTEQPHFKKRSRITESSDAPPPTTRGQKSLAKSIVQDSPEVCNSPESNSPNNTRFQSTSASLTTQPLRATSRRGSMKTDQSTARKGPVKAEEDVDQDLKSEQALESQPLIPLPQNKELRSQSLEKVKNGLERPEATNEAPSQLPTVSRSGSVSDPIAAVANKESKTEPRRSIGSGRLSATLVSNARRLEPPHWMGGALLNIRNSYPSDRVELISKARKEAPAPGQPPVVVGYDWRLKCLDCPGKLYTVGPGESFTNFDVHLKNRQHRQKVDERLTAAGLPPSASSQQISPTTSTHQPSGISSARSSQQLPQTVSSADSSQPQVSPADGSQQIPPTDQLSQPRALSPSQQRLPIISNSPENQAHGSLEQPRVSSILSLHQAHAGVSDPTQISPTTAEGINSQSLEGSSVCNPNHQSESIPTSDSNQQVVLGQVDSRGPSHTQFTSTLPQFPIETQSSGTTVDSLSPSHLQANGPQIRLRSFSDGVQAQNHLALSTNAVHELSPIPSHDAQDSSQLNVIPISSRQISPEDSRQSSQSSIPVTEGINLERVGIGVGASELSERPIGSSSNNNNLPDGVHPYHSASPAGVLYTNRPSSFSSTTTSTNPTLETSTNRKSSVITASTANNNFNSSMPTNRPDNNMSQSHSPSESNSMNINFHSNQNGHEYFHYQHQLLNPSGGIPTSTAPNSNLPTPLIYNNNPNNPGNGIGHGRTPASNNNNHTTFTTNTSTTPLPNLLHPPPPHTLVHPLPKKPTFD